MDQVSLHKLAWWLLIIGGLNWLLIGVAGIDFVAKLGDSVARVVYVLVGLSAVYQLFGNKM